MSKIDLRLAWILILMSYASLLLLGLMDNIRGPFFPDIVSDLGLSGTSGSLFFAVASFSALGGNFVGSFLITRMRSHTLMSLSVAGIGLGFWLIGQSAQFNHLMAACVVFGLNFGILNVSQNVVVQENAPERHRRRIFNGLHSMYGLAALSAPLAASLFLSQDFNWSRTFTWIGGVSAILGMVFLVSSLNLKSQFKAIQEEHLKSKLDFKSVFILIFAMGFYLLAELSLSTRLPLWLRTQYGVGPEAANLYMAYFCGGLLVSRILFTTLSFHRISNLTILRFSTGLSFLFYSLGLLIHPLWSTFAGLSMGPFFPVVMDEISKRFGHEASRVIGWSITLGSVMIVIMHFSLGVLTDAFGVSQALWLGPFGLSVTFLLSWLLKEGGLLSKSQSL